MTSYFVYTFFSGKIVNLVESSDFHEIYSNSRNRNRVIKREIKVIISMYITAKSFCGSKKANISRHINVSDIRKMHQRLFGLKNMTNLPNDSLLSLMRNPFA